MQEQGTCDKLELECRKKLAMSGVETVDGFTEQSLNLTVAGEKVRISGDSIKITSYNKGTGNLTADGKFYEIKYTRKKEPIAKRLFK